MHNLVRGRILIFSYEGNCSLFLTKQSLARVATLLENLEYLEYREKSGNYFLVREVRENLEKSGNFVRIGPNSEILWATVTHFLLKPATS